MKRALRRARRLWYYRQIIRAVQQKRGLEIGGPSAVFSPEQTSTFLPPVYTLAGSIDNCNFATSTAWSQGEAGRTFRYLPDADMGLQYIHDATDLASIADSTYDFLLASHILEHVANPLKALTEFHRVLKPRGSVIVLVPNRAHTFDHRRPYTTFAHLQQDMAAQQHEGDLTHIDEILALHDLSMDAPAGTLDQFRERCLRNRENRCLHHHVFTLDVLEQAFREVRLRPRYRAEWANHLMLFGQKA